MACINNLQIKQTITYSNSENLLGYVLGSLEIEILNNPSPSIEGYAIVDSVRDLTFPTNISDPAISQTIPITANSQTQNVYFYYGYTV